jgi:murein DD-endopeptidase MepM/ murein hydrolase activator NlpD
MKRARAIAVVAIFLLASLPAQAANSSGGYFAPVARGGMVFPVARSNWYSVINFRNDWHAPRMRYINGKWRQVGVHEGNDVFAEPGTPVLAVTPGRVENVGWTFYSGWRVGIRDASNNYWFYAHLRRFAPGISPGDRVAAGAVIGEVGNTGYGSDLGHDDEFIYHLHLGIQEPNGRWINPYPVLRRLYRAATQAVRSGTA